ncbi:MAG: glycosyltransferase family 39 protein, partial [Chloroflexota bacterium]
PLYVIAGVFVVLCALYAFATPIFEASDELWHFGMVDYIATNRTLPVQNPDIETRYEQEGSQPPLYYAIGALLIHRIDRSDYDTHARMNPHARVGIPGSVRNKNIVLHEQLNLPLQQTVLAVYVLRAFSVLLGMVTLIAVYAAAINLGGSSYAALATGLVAFNPMFLFITASVNNDNMVTMLNSLVIWQLVVMAWHGFRWQRSLFIAIVISLASLSKLSGNVLVPAIVALATYVAWRDNHWRGFITLGVLMAVAWAVIAGWWYWRNIQLYGELFGTQMMVAVAGPRMEPFTFQTILDEFEGFRIAYWGLFGGVNVLTFQVYYRLMDLLVIAAVGGLAFALRDVLPYLWRTMTRYRRPLTILDALNLYWLVTAVLFTLIFVTGLVSVIVWTAQTYASQGRLLFPFVAASGLLLASGLMYWWRGKKWHFAAALVGAYAVFALVVPFVSIRPAYTAPPTITELPDDVNPVYARYGDVALVGYRTDDRRYEPGEQVLVTVYWEVLEPSERDLSAFLTALNPAGDAIGKVDTYPGGGTLTTSTWDAGTIIADTYGIPLGAETNGQFDLRMQVGWWHYPTEDVIEPIDANGNSIESVILDVGGFSDGGLPPVRNPFFRLANFNRQIHLLGYAIGADNHELTLRWSRAGNIDDDLTVFVQVLDADGNIVGQGDAPPALSTSYWERGEVVSTRHTMNYPEPLDSGDYQVLVGWYDPIEGDRLLLRRDADADNAFPLATITVP